jgi:esterase/lipase superfamily enzyme
MNAPRHSRYQRLHSQHMDRPVHLWTYGWYGAPVLVFPSAAGMAHEWQHSGAVAALQPWIDAGKIKLYCPETNVSVAWTGEGDPRWRLAQHVRYERFVVEELVEYIRRDCGDPKLRVATAGASFGAFYAVNTALKYPDRFHWALGLSGRYRPEAFLNGHQSHHAYMNQPLAHVAGLSGEALRAARQVHFTLVVGRGAYEGRCTIETAEMANALARMGIPVHLDMWGHDVSHEWVWWKRQIVHHLGNRLVRHA